VTREELLECIAAKRRKVAPAAASSVARRGSGGYPHDALNDVWVGRVCVRVATHPTRAILNSDSTLIVSVQNGLGAMKTTDIRLIGQTIRASFSDSLDLDEALRANHPNDPRWDYLLGHEMTSKVIGLEAHSATTGEVSVVIEKRRRAQDQLRTHMKLGERVADWFWVASGKTDFVPHTRESGHTTREQWHQICRETIP
jgi:hypothetical protein